MKPRSLFPWIFLLVALAVVLVVLRGFLHSSAEPLDARTPTPSKSDTTSTSDVHRAPSADRSEKRRVLPPATGDSAPSPSPCLFGIVLDTTGAPVAGAQIELSKSGVEDAHLSRVDQRGHWDTFPIQAVAQTTSDADGRFTFSGIDAGRLQLVAREESYGDALLFVHVPHAGPLRVTLNRQHQLPGRVIDRITESSIAQAAITVVVTRIDGGISHVLGLLRTTSRNDGSFDIPLPNSESQHGLVVRVRADGYVPITEGFGMNHGQPEPARLLLKMNRGRALQIHLLPKGAEEPLGGVKVLLESYEAPYHDFPYHVVTDDEGAADVDDFPITDKVRVLLFDDFWALDTTDTPSIDKNTAMGGQILRVTKEEGACLTIPVVPSASLRGQVLDVDTSRPVAGIKLQVGRYADFWHPSSSVFTRTLQTDEDGRFSSSGLWRTRTYAYVLPGSWCNWPQGWGGIPPGSPGFPLDRFINPVDLAANTSASITIYAKKTAQIEGRVVDERGHPLEGVELKAKDLPTDRWIYSERRHSDTTQCTTDSRGRFKLEHIPPRPTFEFQGRKPGFPRSLFGPYALEPGKSRNVGDIVMRRSARVTVVVRGPAGPVPGVRVLLTARSPDHRLDSPVTLTTDASGTATTTAMESPRVSWRILNCPEDLAVRGLRNEVTVNLALDGADRIEIEMTERHFFVGVMQTSDGKPFGRGMMLARRILDETTGKLAAQPSLIFCDDVEGRFRFPAQPGTYMIEWMSRDESKVGRTKDVRVDYSVATGSRITTNVPTTVIAGKPITPQTSQEKN